MNANTKQKEEDLDPEDMEDEHNTVETRSKCKNVFELFCCVCRCLVFVLRPGMIFCYAIVLICLILLVFMFCDRFWLTCLLIACRIRIPRNWTLIRSSSLSRI